MTHMTQLLHTPPRPSQRGATLIEILVSVLVLSIGLLGITGLQARAMQSGQSAFERSQAVMLSYFILDAMRANRAVALAGEYDVTMRCDIPAAGSSLRENDQTAWFTALKRNLGDRSTTCGEIACDIAAETCTVTVQWDDSRALGGSSSQTLTTSTRL